MCQFRGYGNDVECKGLGTPATRADVIEQLGKDGFIKREKKHMIPTEDGVKRITVLSDVLKSPKLTADWENPLTLVAKGEYSIQDYGRHRGYGKRACADLSLCQ